ncbi:hypothetical protein [Hasllibacter sp. MH4015]|uniref:hypothetical protein n=1 Tax=Hasllibacter sp. MH4015 TaxID=2854029 RepID=UPI001CD3A07D|nr:hypothetical protein [Hasllibacter sp. MH4015]
MTRPTILALAAILASALPASADVPDWLSGEWRTAARLTAPDGARIRIRCTLDAASASSDWSGTLGCATVQGRFEGRWQIATSGPSATGRVVFSGTEAADLSVSGSVGADAMSLQSPDGQGVSFRPGADGALIVEMDRLGPQRLTGALTFETR